MTERKRPRSAASRLLLLTVIPHLCAACVQVELPARAPEDLPESFSTTGGSEPPDRWWRALDDERLDELVDRGLAESPRLEAVWDRLERAAAVVDRDGAELLPAIDVTASAAHDRGGTDGASFDDSSFAFGAVASYELDLWGRVSAGVRAAELEYRARAADVRASAITMSATIAETWYMIAEQSARAALIESQIDTNERVLTVLRSRFRLGQSSAEDVLRQRQLVETRRGDLALSRGALAILRHRLAVLVGRPPVAAHLPEPGRLVELPPLPDTGVPLELVLRRPDLVAMWLRIEASYARVARAIADTYPRISLAASGETVAESAAGLFQGWQAALLANLVGPLFDGGRRKAEIRIAKAEALEAFHLYRDAVLVALGEVEDALAEEARQRELARSLERQLDLSERVMTQARGNYRAGIEDFLGLLDATRTHEELERDALQARLDLILARISLHRALAGGWDMDPPETQRT